MDETKVPIDPRLGGNMLDVIETAYDALKANETLYARILELEEAIRGGWKQVDCTNVQCCGFCGKPIGFLTMWSLGAKGWDAIIHYPDCIMLTIEEDTR